MIAFLFSKCFQQNTLRFGLTPTPPKYLHGSTHSKSNSALYLPHTKMLLRLNKASFVLNLWNPLYTVFSFMVLLISIPLLLLALFTTILALSFTVSYVVVVCGTAILASWRTSKPPPLSEKTVEKIMYSPRGVHNLGGKEGGFNGREREREKGLQFKRGWFWSWPPRRVRGRGRGM
jgi:hypothetical protein